MIIFPYLSQCIGLGSDSCSAAGRSGGLRASRGKPHTNRLCKSFAWALGPPIEMKIEPSRVYDQAGVDGKDRGNSG
jgi:hypothetical protein